SFSVFNASLVIEPACVCQVGEGAFWIALSAHTQADTGEPFSKPFLVGEYLAEADSLSIGLLGLCELPQHAQAVADTERRIALTVNICFGFVGCVGTAVEVQRVGETALLTCAFALAKKRGWMKKWISHNRGEGHKKEGRSGLRPYQAGC